MTFFSSTTARFLLATLFFTLPWAEKKMVLFGLPLYPPEIITLLALLALVPRFWRARRSFGRSGDRVILWGSALFLGGVTLSFLGNPFSLSGLGLLKTWFYFPAFAALLVFVVARTLLDVRSLFFSWFFSGLGVALTGLLFFFHRGVTYDGRLALPYTSPNFLAFYLAPSILIALSFLVTFRQKNTWWFWERAGLFASLGILLIALFLTHSYGAWLAVFCSATLFLFGKYHHDFSLRRTLLIGAVLVLFLSSFFLLEQNGDKWQALISHSERSSFASRMIIWRAGLAMAVDAPFLGIGVGRFQETYLRYQQDFPPYLEWAVPQPHNLLLALWLETGALGLLGFLLVVGRSVWLLARNFLHSVDTGQKNLTLLTFSLLGLYLLLGLTDTPYFHTDSAFLFWLLLALGGSIVRYQKPS